MSKRHDHNTDTQIIQQRIAGRTTIEVAKDFKISPRTVERIMHQAKTGGFLEREILASEWRRSMKAKSIQAIQDGLDHRQDKYKRADIGIRVMRGIGEFTETIQGLHLLVQTVPGDWKDDFSSTPANPEE